MSDLGSRLREHYETISPPIDIDALLTEQPRHPLPSRRLRLNVAIAVGAAALTVMIAIPGLLLRTSVDAPIIAPAPSDTPGRGQPSEPTDPPAGPSTITGPLSWTLVERPDLQPDWFWSPLWSDGTTIYYGPPGGWYSTADGTVWTSDERHLDRLHHPAVAPWSGRVLAVDEPLSQQGSCVGSVNAWLASAGAKEEHWTLPLEPFGLAGCVAVGTESVEPGLTLGPVALGPRGAIILATATPNLQLDDRAVERPSLIGWRSTDLGSWQPIADLPAALATEGESPVRHGTMSLTPASDGFVLTGWDGRVWFTTDGADWKQIADDPDLAQGAWVGTVRGQVLAIGQRRAWRLTGTGATPLGDLPDDVQDPEHVAIGDAGIAIVLPVAPDSEGAVLFSTDGSVWTAQARPSSWGTLAGWSTHHPVVVGRDVVIVMTETTDGRGDDVELWLGR